MSPKVGQQPMRRSQVIEAVIALAAESGLETLTLEAVANQAGVSKGVVAYYFKDKRTLLLESFKALLDQYNQFVAVRMHEGMPASELAFVIVDACLMPGGCESEPLPDRERKRFGVPLEHHSRVLIHFFHKSILDRDFREVLREMYGVFYDGLKLTIQYGISTGEFKALDEDSAAYGLFALLDGILIHRAIGYAPLPLEQTREICRDYIMNMTTQRSDFPGGQKNE